MKKIPTLFVRDFTEPSNGRYVTRDVHPDCRWVLDGEGVATRKYDGTSLTFDGIRDTVVLLADGQGFEGLVWHHPDGRMAKIKRRDFPGGAR